MHQNGHQARGRRREVSHKRCCFAAPGKQQSSLHSACKTSHQTSRRLASFKAAVPPSGQLLEAGLLLTTSCLSDYLQAAAGGIRVVRFLLVLNSKR